jgi:hypothetical protein
MNKFKYYFIVIITSLFLFSCSKDNNSFTPEPLRDFGEQYTADNTTIEEYLNDYTFEVVDAPGEQRDQDVIFTKITDPVNEKSIMDYLDSPSFPKLLKRDIELHDITYSVYYLMVREGVGESPCNVDAVLASYRGQYLYKTTVDNVSSLTPTQFEEVKFPQAFFNLYEVITGWSEIFPQFKVGTYVSNSDGSVTYNDFGAGVMFLPSGLAYYSSGSGSIPSYTPLVFSFKLYEIKRSDVDADGIPSYLEDLNHDGYMRTLASGVSNPDDTDGDGIPDYLDVDDDGDGYRTRLEISVNGVVTPFDLIPDCSGNTTNSNRIKKYLDKNCH